MDVEVDSHSKKGSMEDAMGADFNDEEGTDAEFSMVALEMHHTCRGIRPRPSGWSTFAYTPLHIQLLMRI